MRLPSFRLHRPASLDLALGLLSEYRNDGQLYMGGTELLLLMKLGLAAPAHLIDCKRVPDLHGLDIGGRADWVIGAATTHRVLELSPAVRQALPVLASLEREVANVRVRNAGTIGGNLCFAEPHSDPATLLVALGAVADLASAGGTRSVDLTDFLIGPLTTSLAPGEIMLRVRFASLGRDTAVRFLRLAFRERPVINMAYVRRGTEHRLVVGAVGPRPARLEATEALIAQGDADPGSVARTAGEEVMVLEDADGGAAYKRHLTAVLARRLALGHSL